VTRIVRFLLLSGGLATAVVAPLRAEDDAPLPIPKPDFAAPAAPPSETAAPPMVLAAVQTHERPETRIGDSGLPVPRFVSLKSGEVYLREGPSSGHKVEWVYVRRGLPVEVIAEYDVWRRIRDADGVVGWVHKGMLDGKRSVLMLGADNVPVRESAAPDAAIIAYAEPGVVAKLKACGGAFCEVQAQAIDGYVARVQVWGVYDGETVE
jgi:SH3-like domain-containing protein